MSIELRFAAFAIAWTAACWLLLTVPTMVLLVMLVTTWGMRWLTDNRIGTRESEKRLPRGSIAAIVVLTAALAGFLVWTLVGRICCAEHGPYPMPAWSVGVLWLVGIASAAWITHGMLVERDARSIADGG